MGDINLGTKLKNLDEDVNTKIADNGDWLKSKNLINPTLETITSNGVTCTNNGDGTYTLNGTASKIIRFDILQDSIFKSGVYRLTGTPSNGGNNLLLQLVDKIGGIVLARDMGYGVTFAFNGDTIAVQIRIESGETLNNVTFKPMITEDLTATYDDFKPYVKSNVELESNLAALIETLKSKGVID